MAKLYARDHDAKTPEVSPLFGDLKACRLCYSRWVPQKFYSMIVGRSRAAEAAGVAVELEVWDDMIHGWHGYAHALTRRKSLSTGSANS